MSPSHPALPQVQLQQADRQRSSLIAVREAHMQAMARTAVLLCALLGLALHANAQGTNQYPRLLPNSESMARACREERCAVPSGVPCQ